ncbi:MAG: hypothetical protein CME62_14630 [Halobacteriovoraceae bacterium]|nr:hypothetical protein [Halobacteriovoraceae bacterium]|tara:strand:+ start:5448 stop:6323 length:876 start_codon:yes stop_codon:yes gene_type:complete
MNETFDRLIIRILFTIFICLALFIYKYAHVIFYPSGKKQLLKRIYPAENYIDTLHIFSRIIGVSIIFSTLEFNEYFGISISLVHFLTWSLIGFSLYLVSIYVSESIIFYNFEYKDEVLKKKNAAYGMVGFVNSICLALIVKKIFTEAENSLIILLIMWLFSMVLYGFSTKLYKYVSDLNFNSQMIQQNLGLGFSFGGYLLGVTVIITASFSHEHIDITSYLVQVILKVLLGALILPLFMLGIKFIFKVDEEGQDYKTIGHGVYSGSVFLAASFLTSIIVGQINFGTIYPFF